MSSKLNSIINESVLKILRPLVRVMIRNGISTGSFEELARKAYVDEAFAMGVKNKQKTTISSVSAQTGLSRKEVKRLVEQQAAENIDVEQKYNRAIRVISGWLNDKNFSDENGKAQKLVLSDTKNSFSILVKQYSGDIPPKAMLNLLLAAGCVKVTDDSVQLIKHAYVPGNDSIEIMRILGTDTSEILNTIDYNFSATLESKRYQRKVSTALLDPDAVDKFKKLSSKRSQALLEELDAWLSQHEAAPDNDNAKYVSLGIYYYEQESSGDHE